MFEKAILPKPVWKGRTNKNVSESSSAKSCMKKYAQQKCFKR